MWSWTLLLGIIIPILSGLFLALRSQSVSFRRTRNKLILCGGVDSGKTALFLRLLEQPFGSTVTSASENAGRFKDWLLVDVPGNARIREQFLTPHWEGARAVVFMLDAASDKWHLDVPFLLSVLAQCKQNRLSPLVLFGRTDLSSQPIASLIQRLEQEVSRLVLKYVQMDEAQTDHDKEMIDCLKTLKLLDDDQGCKLSDLDWIKIDSYSFNNDDKQTFETILSWIDCQ